MAASYPIVDQAVYHRPFGCVVAQPGIPAGDGTLEAVANMVLLSPGNNYSICKKFNNAK